MHWAQSKPWQSVFFAAFVFFPDVNGEDAVRIVIGVGDHEVVGNFVGIGEPGQRAAHNGNRQQQNDQGQSQYFFLGVLFSFALLFFDMQVFVRYVLSSCMSQCVARTAKRYDHIKENKITIFHYPFVSFVYGISFGHIFKFWVDDLIKPFFCIFQQIVIGGYVWRDKYKLGFGVYFLISRILRF